MRRACAKSEVLYPLEMVDLNKACELIEDLQG